MNLVIIACCKTKAPGGVQMYPNSPISHFGDHQTRDYLMNCRRELAMIFNLAPGHDLGFADQTPWIEYRPAFDRYTGNMYRSASFEECYPRRKNCEVWIVSAQYGLLDASDPIRWYELAMDHRLPDGQKVGSWWQDRGLGDIVAKVVKSSKATYVHEFLPESYRKVLGDWHRPGMVASIIVHRYPGQGSGSNYSRGRDLKRLMDCGPRAEDGKRFSEERLRRIREILIRLGEELDPDYLFPTIVPAAGKLVASDPYAFLIACSLDRRMPSEIAWTIPWDIKEDLGHLDPFIIRQMAISELEDLFKRLPRRPRYVNDAPRTISDLTALIVDHYDCDATQIWQDRPASEVKQALMGIHGIGEGISNMTVLLIEKAFDTQFEDLDRPSMNIKADVHTMRVLYRLGIAERQDEQSAIRAARLICPDFPGAIDAGLWYVGRTWCHASDPDCGSCPLSQFCEMRIGPPSL